LSGVTLAVKDLFGVAGHVSSFGHAQWRATHQPSAQTAPVIAQLLAAGAQIAGLAKLDQLAYSIVGNAGEGTPPLNPAYPDRFTCGSSSGSAAAVAAGLASAGVGTDTGGSVRAPAAACGLYGLRPSHGAISAEGVLPLAPSFDTVGFLAADPGLIGQLLAAVGVDLEGSGPRQTRIHGTRVIVPAGLDGSVSPQTAQAVRSTARGVAGVTGGEVREVDLSDLLHAEVADLFARLQGRELWAGHGSWLAENIGALAPDVAARVRRAEQLSASPDADKRADQGARAGYVTALEERLPVDAVAVLPVFPDLPPLRTALLAEITEFRALAFRFTTPASLSGRPELVIPVRRTVGGAPRGVGLLGPRGSDADLVRLAVALRAGPV
jgi:amidase